MTATANIYVDIDGLFFWRVSDNGQVLAVGPRKGTKAGAIENFGRARQAMRNVDMIVVVNEDNLPPSQRIEQPATRWNPIDNDGNITPAMAVPPDPNTGGDDEGETGPPMEVIGDQILGAFEKAPDA